MSLTNAFGVPAGWSAMVFCSAAAVLLLAGLAGADYAITWESIDSGGGTSSGGGYVLSGTAGQWDAGVVSGGDYVLSGGFRPGNVGCVVNLTDLSVLAEHWMEAGVSAIDLDGLDGIGMGDFAELSYWWYGACPGDWPIK